MVFPTIVGFPRYILCLDIANCFSYIFDLVHTSKVRLWPNELGHLFPSTLSSTSREADIQLPEKYKEFSDVFDKVKANTLPEHRPYDCPIDLQPGKEPLLAIQHVLLS